MRNAPSFFHPTAEGAAKLAYEQAKTTHMGDGQALCCACHAFIGWRFAHNQPVEAAQLYEEFKAVSPAPITETVAKMLRGEGFYSWMNPAFQLDREGTYVGSYAVDGLALVLFYFYTLQKPADCPLPEAQYKLQLLAGQGGDADSTCAILGPLLGARFGLSAFGENWIQGVQRFDEQGLLPARCAGLFTVFGTQ